MRSKLLVSFVVVLLSAVALSGSASAQSGDDAGAFDTVTGTATSVIGTITVDARKPAGGSPSDASGEFVADGSLLPLSPGGEMLGGGDLPLVGSFPAFHLEGPVTCLDVQGNRAALIYPIDRSNPEFLEQQAVLFTIVDNGPGKADAVGFYGPAPIGRFDACPASMPTFLTVTEGDLVVTDVSP